MIISLQNFHFLLVKSPTGKVKAKMINNALMIGLDWWDWYQSKILDVGTKLFPAPLDSIDWVLSRLFSSHGTSKKQKSFNSDVWKVVLANPESFWIWSVCWIYPKVLMYIDSAVCCVSLIQLCCLLLLSLCRRAVVIRQFVPSSNFLHLLMAPMASHPLMASLACSSNTNPTHR